MQDVMNCVRRSSWCQHKRGVDNAGQQVTDRLVSQRSLPSTSPLLCESIITSARSCPYVKKEQARDLVTFFSLLVDLSHIVASASFRPFSGPTTLHFLGGLGIPGYILTRRVVVVSCTCYFL